MLRVVGCVVLVYVILVFGFSGSTRTLFCGWAGSLVIRVAFVLGFACWFWVLVVEVLACGWLAGWGAVFAGTLCGVVGLFRVGCRMLRFRSYVVVGWLMWRVWWVYCLCLLILCGLLGTMAD